MQVKLYNQKFNNFQYFLFGYKIKSTLNQRAKISVSLAMRFRGKKLGLGVSKWPKTSLAGGGHMWLMGCPNPYEMERSWECTFLKLLTHMNTKWASKKIFIEAILIYQLSSTAKPALNGLNWPYCLAGRSEWLRWKKFLILILCSYGSKVSEKCTPNFVQFRKG